MCGEQDCNSTRSVFALGNTLEEQMESVKFTSKSIVDLIGK